jgi:serine O-acetyltransferase
MVASTRATIRVDDDIARPRSTSGGALMCRPAAPQPNVSGVGEWPSSKGAAMESQTAGTHLGPVMAILREDLAVHGSVSSPGFRALCMYRFGRWRAELTPGLLRKALRPAYLLWHRRVRRRYRIELHATATVGRRVRLSDGGDIVIGNDVTIGDDCILSQGVTLGKASDRSTGWPRIQSGVRIGPGAIIIGAITVGADAVIGPNAVVADHVPTGAVVSSPPATVVARRASTSVGPTRPSSSS